MDSPQDLQKEMQTYQHSYFNPERPVSDFWPICKTINTTISILYRVFEQELISQQMKYDNGTILMEFTSLITLLIT